MRMIPYIAVAICAWAGLGRLWAENPAAAPRPNILLILADDYGVDGVGCYGSDRFKGKTPHIDALASSGIRFERCYSAPLCGPTRCLITTGRYGFRTGGLTNQSAGQPSSAQEPSMAKILKAAGYATGMGGKWRQMGEMPADWGYDEYITDPRAGGYYWQKGYTKNGQLVEKDAEIYYPDVAHAFAIDFIRRHRDGPFFYYYPSHLVHGPILRTPDTKPETGKNHEALYEDNVAYLDKQVGELVAEVDKLGIREKTLILFTGDNGTARQSGTIGGRQVNGAKGSMLEGGARVPLVASWKGTAPQGCVIRDLVDFSDLVPTFAELAGAKMPEGVTFDGRSFAPQLRGDRGNPREWIFVQLGGRWYVRDDGWKMNQAGALFDMRDAPFVEAAVAADSQDPAATAARERLGAVLEKLNPAGGKSVPIPDRPKKKRRGRK
ncbi:MAG TPA: sulfatase-like hydrolase/transferase [Verrucomicrobiae bacterium]|mgnify:CR=1 FL=1|nr:sulfatase-like hydrolase/transferase [Verrucomicrobiae bacterium]